MAVQLRLLQNEWCLASRIHSIGLRTCCLRDQVTHRNSLKNPISNYPCFCPHRNLIDKYLAHQIHPLQLLSSNCLCFEATSSHFEALLINLRLLHQGWACPKEQFLSFTKLEHLLWLLADLVSYTCSCYVFAILSHVRSPSSGFRFYAVKLSILELHLLLQIKDSSFPNPI